jgi:murein L,D-transpeptidase YcbB/YkuD
MLFRHFPISGLLLVVVACCAACQNHAPAPAAPPQKDTVPRPIPEKDLTIAGSFSPQKVLHFDSSQVGLFFKKYSLFKNLQPQIRKFYSSRHYAYAWFDNSGLIDQAEHLYNRLSNITEEGLPDTIPYKDSLNSIFDVYSDQMQQKTPERELFLTAQYFHYANSAWGGISEKKSRSIDWFLPRKKIDLPQLLDSLLRDSSSAILKKGYATRQYSLLRRYLQKYRDLAARGSWPRIKPDRAVYDPLDSSGVIAAVREKLFLLGDLAENNSSPILDNGLEAAIRQFQRRNGLNDDGRLGRGTIEKINLPPATYIRKILVNMERNRWIPVDMENEYLVVNIPDFLLFAYDQDSIAFRMKVVVGQRMHKTVIFNGDLKYVVFSPYWNVPPEILRKEVLPGIRRNPDYLNRNNMEWNGNTVRQKPGPKNSLGLVKFLFPNSYNIYLHDSPAKSLFNEQTRAFSHGCIRVAEPKKLAMYLLRKQPEWTEAAIDAAMHAGKEKYVTLKSTVPVFIAYLTAWVDREGKLNIRDDIYERDHLLADMMINPKK